MGVAVGDFDDDGDPDVYVTNDGPDRLFRNEGDAALAVRRHLGENVALCADANMGMLV